VSATVKTAATVDHLCCGLYKSPLPGGGNDCEGDLRGALAAGVARLEAAGVPSAPLAAELLLMHVTGHDRAWLYAHPESALNAEQQRAYAALVGRRAGGVPVQYLTGRQEFWGLEFEVTPDVLIPRPETEHVVEVALSRLGARCKQPLAIADVGTGSGCLAVALASELPQARVVATDISPAALAVARRNVARHGVAGRVECLEMNLLSSYLAAPLTSPAAPVFRADGRFDLIVSNPPYIGLEESAELPREVREHEPEQALFAGPHGLEVYPGLIAQAGALLGDGGLLVIEMGHGAAGRIRPLLENGAWTGVMVTPDLAGIERVLSAERSLRRQV
jgi:release factor glutamine methyltransferase